MAQTTCPIIPLPADARLNSGAFKFDNTTTIVTTQASLQPIAQYLQQGLSQKSAIQVKLGKATKGSVVKLVLTGNKQDKLVQLDAYSLDIQPTQITITAPSAAGVFYGVISLLQLTAQSKDAAVACWSISDIAGYGWRGFMLDESRHFFGKAKVKQLLDWMAFYKLNRFHWHLTDEPGWRIEIKKYPALTLTGGKGNYTDSLAPAQYYTQQEIKEIVAYAAARFITVIPEIDMPGHATAANRAYPEYSGGGSAKHPEFTFNPGKEGTYQYLTNILKETDALFPSQMIHIGGDEVSFGNEKWMANPDIQQLMAREKLTDAKGVEFYFIRRMADCLATMKNKVLAWDEVTQANLVPEQTIVFWWRHDQPRQLTTSLQKGYSVVLCPRLPFYFDFVQDSAHVSGRKWGPQKGYASLEKVYDFSVADYPIQPGQLSQVLGLQANLWTETIKTEQRLDFMTFPRMLALAETAWTDPQQKNFNDFVKRMEAQLPLLKQQGIQYYDFVLPQQSPEPKR
ncbi:beta-hexosaminidase [Paraflavitalea soli]|uniref:beta-N-acetylhexosaminidase n=2 Tax=Paraflavitalea soli TaxID=2315862 RepID=A0A3B7MFL9_9BACT|nr:beta-hexosaminidase [Paraflavitalea soli]